jgi:hypothetical protein
MKCGKCKKENKEVKTFKVVPNGLIAKIFTLGGVEINLCQSCISKLLRKCDPKK